MTEKIRLEIDDATSPGLNSVEKNLDDVGDAANRAEKELNQAAAATKKLGDGGSKDVKGLGFQVISLNQALEVGKKAIEAANAAITALAADGSPAFVRLNEEIGKTYAGLLKIADDPAIQQLADNLSQSIEGSLVPSLSKVPGLLREWTYSAEDARVRFLEMIGAVSKGTADVVKNATEAAKGFGDAAKEIIAADRERILIDEKLAEITSRLTNEIELKNIAQSNSASTLKTIMEDEEEAMREQERAGTATAKSRESSLKKIELIQRRLVDIAKQESESEIKEQERVAQVKADLQKQWEDAVKASAAANAEIESERLTKLRDEAKAETEKLVAAIAQAKGSGGGNLLDETRAGISPEQTRAQLVKQAADAARQKFISENRDKVDLQGRASGNTSRERFENQRAADRQIALAQRNAGSKAFRDFNAGKTSESDIAGAQNALINNAAQSAVGRGQLDQQTANALATAAQTQQQMIQTQQQQAQVLAQIQAALGQNNQASRNTFANGRRMQNSR